MPSQGKDHSFEKAKVANGKPIYKTMEDIAHPPPGEEVVISGISGCFPESDNVNELRDNLFSKRNLLTKDNRRWDVTFSDIPTYCGKINNLEKFDAGFFGLEYQEANYMDSGYRICLEKAVECIMDAGMNPHDLEGSRCGVFLGLGDCDRENQWYFQHAPEYKRLVLESLKVTAANKISHFLKLKGPSYTCDTACSTTLIALADAYIAIREGLCDSAIVGGTQLCIHPFVTLQFASLGVLSFGSTANTFDVNANGYTRSETVGCIFLQKAKDAKRVYGQILHMKSNCDGYKPEGITFPNSDMQSQLMQEVYDEVHIDPTLLSYLEAHGTSTKVGDPVEVASTSKIYCSKPRPPLLIGSVKSNLGHSEYASGLCSLAKVFIAAETGFIPPNINFYKPKDEMEALVDGRMKVVTEKTPFQDDRGLLAVNNFGFGGVNVHLLMRWNTKVKVNGGLARDNLPRMVCVSGRTRQAVGTMLDECKPDIEYISLLNNIFRRNIVGHMHRGYSIISKSGEITRSIKYYTQEEHKLYVSFGLFDEWQEIGSELMEIPVFSGTINNIHNILATRNVNITDIMTAKKRHNKPMNCVLGNMAVNLGIVDILKTVELNVESAFGTSSGALIASYFSGVLSLEETVLLSYELACIIENDQDLLTTPLIKKKSVKSSIENGESKQKQNGVMRNGAPDNNGIYSTLDGICLDKVEKQLLDSFNSILKKTKGQTVAQNMVNAVKSTMTAQMMKRFSGPNLVLLQIGNLSMQVNQNDLKGIEIVGFNRKHSDSVQSLLEMLGTVYNHGFCMKINALYPAVDYPVSRGTPMIAPSIKWNHEDDWYVDFYKPRKHAGIMSFKIDIQDKKISYVTGHVVDGLNLFPATGYLYLVWEAIGSAIDKLIPDMSIEFENCRFNRATTVPKEGFIKLDVNIHTGTGNFEVSEGRTCIVTGTVRAIDKFKLVNLPVPPEVLTPESRPLPLLTKDVYKELKLRGYHYKGLFKSILECDNSVQKAMIRWTDNWVAFMDNMLQMKILQYDTRALYVPTFIERVRIDAPKHLQLVKERGGEKEIEETYEQETVINIEELPPLPVYAYSDSNVIKCGGIEITGLQASPITRRKPLGEPVLEKYEFVSNIAKLPTEVSTRVNMQLILENNYAVKFNVIELIDEATRRNSQPLSPTIAQAFGDLPLISPNIIIYSNEPIEVENVTVEKKTLGAETDCLLIVGTNILSRETVQFQVLGALAKDGFILSRESLEFNPSKYKSTKLSIITIHDTGSEKLVLVKRTTSFTSPTVISVTQPDFEWLEDLKTALRNGNNVVIYAQNEDLNGVIGLCNCLKIEVGTQRVRCFSIVDKEAPAFDIENELYKNQLEKNLTVNVLKNGQWGTYRHLLLEENENTKCEHCYVDVAVVGDLSSLRWIEGPLSSNSQADLMEKTLVYVYHSALNFKDVMVGSGRINVDSIRERSDTEGLLGLEYAGKTADGKRVMGMVTGGGISTMLACDTNFMFDVPNYWSLEDAATVSCVYITVLYAFHRAGGLKKGMSILIHSGAGGVGQAAINVALHYDCEIFTTVGSPDKLEFIKKTFPQIPDSHIGNSRDISFVDMVMKQTEGRGVDVVLNSLAEEKLISSVRCLAPQGHFLEIGRFDLSLNNKLSVALLEKNANHYGVMVDLLMKATPDQKQVLKKLFEEGLKNGSIKPLKRHVFQRDQIEEAFRFMAAGKHIGKVLIEVRKEEAQKTVAPQTKLWKAVPRYHCNPDKSYIICGGLGGFGLELADWLVLRGARKLVLTSRKGIRNGYQAYRIKIWKAYGTNVEISTKDITTRKGCLDLIKQSNNMGPVDAIFNLAVILRDALLENQTVEDFNTSFAPKAYATTYLDELSREHCPELRDFVVFSSVSCGRGNAGQTNYGMANSVMEKICEKRRQEGYPAVAIEWGAVGDVGLVADMQEEDKELEIGGTLQQRISSCLQVMDIFLRQRNPIVSSMVVAEKKLAFADNCVDAVANILGINVKNVSMQTTLSELGMDSMRAVEVKQTLERDFSVILTAKEIRSLTFSRLQELSSKDEDITSDTLKTASEATTYMIDMVAGALSHPTPELQIKTTVSDGTPAPKVIVLPGIEGIANTMKPLIENLECHATVLQYGFLPGKSIDDILQSLQPYIQKHIRKTEPVRIIGYSFGAVFALETVAILEREGYKASVFLIDGFPGITKMIVSDLVDDPDFDLKLILRIFSMFTEKTRDSIEKITKAVGLQNQIKEAFKILSEDKFPGKPNETLEQILFAMHRHMTSSAKYEPKYPKVKSPVILCKASIPVLPNLPEDYGLPKYCENLNVSTFDGTHSTVLQNPLLTKAINQWLTQ